MRAIFVRTIPASYNYTCEQPRRGATWTLRWLFGPRISSSMSVNASSAIVPLIMISGRTEPASKARIVSPH